MFSKCPLLPEDVNHIFMKCIYHYFLEQDKPNILRLFKSIIFFNIIGKLEPPITRHDFIIAEKDQDLNKLFDNLNNDIFNYCFPELKKFLHNGNLDAAFNLLLQQSLTPKNRKTFTNIMNYKIYHGPHATLGLPSTATWSEVKKKRSKLILTCHPDKLKQSLGESDENFKSRQNLSRKKFEVIQTAYEELERKTNRQ